MHSVSPRPSALTSRLTIGLSPKPDCFSPHTPHPHQEDVTRPPSGTPSGFLSSPSAEILPTQPPTADPGWKCLPIPSSPAQRACHPHSRSSPPALPVLALTSWWCLLKPGLVISSQGPPAQGPTIPDRHGPTIPALFLPSWVTLGEVLNFWEPRFLHLQNGNISI